MFILTGKSKVNCIVLEDEPAAQSILENYIARCPGLVCSGFFRDAYHTQVFLDNNKIDLLFLDINLPGMNGISFLRSLVHPPMVVFTSAYPKYAMDGFDLEIIDFLLKPFSFERFCRSVNKAKEMIHSGTKPFANEKITVKSDKQIHRIAIDDILFVESCGDYVILRLADKKLVVHGTLKSWEEKLKSFSFMKVHRSFIVNLLKIDHIDGNQVVAGTYRLPLADSFKAPLMETILKR
jgi:DNA-binding LytR/AlgR family response regulator